MIERFTRGVENSVLFAKRYFLPTNVIRMTSIEICLLVIGATRVHPVTSRTRKLRSSALMVLGGQPPGRVGHCQETFHLIFFKSRWYLPFLPPLAAGTGAFQRDLSFNFVIASEALLSSRAKRNVPSGYGDLGCPEQTNREKRDCFAGSQ
jgi:hypothetical protein